MKLWIFMLAWSLIALDIKLTSGSVDSSFVTVMMAAALYKLIDSIAIKLHQKNKEV